MFKSVCVLQKITFTCIYFCPGITVSSSGLENQNEYEKKGKQTTTIATATATNTSNAVANNNFKVFPVCKTFFFPHHLGQVFPLSTLQKSFVLLLLLFCCFLVTLTSSPSSSSSSTRLITLLLLFVVDDDDDELEQQEEDEKKDTDWLTMVCCLSQHLTNFDVNHDP